jgi:hypothetical protein
MLLIDDGQPQSTLVIGPQASWIERRAAEELRKYLRKMSGADLPITESAPSEGTIIAIGRAESNPVIAQAIDCHLVTLSDSYPGRDGFVIKTVRFDEQDVLILGGSMDRGMLYAAYALLEEVLGIGFFRDGERIPHSSTIEIPDIDISERPQFAERADGFIAYSQKFWHWDDWMRELDWKVKHRANQTWPFHVGNDIISTIMYEWGVVPEPPGTNTPTEQERLLEHAHKLGLRVPCDLPRGTGLPDAFFEAFPDCQTLSLQWSEYEPYRQLHPADPLLHRLIVDYIRHYRKRYGSDHLYIAEFAAESRIVGGAASNQEVRLDFVRTVSGALKEADPEGVWLPCSWSFDLSADDPGNPWEANWTIDNIREYLDTISVPFSVFDLWAEEAEKYVQTDYFFGHRWGFGVLHSFGAGSYIHGDVPGLVNRVHRLLNDPEADKCEFYHTHSEIVDNNDFYYELSAQLSWDPTDVTVERHVRDFCRKRYGQVGEALEEAWWLLVDTVYGPESGTVKIIMDPAYWFRLDLELIPGWPEDEERTSYLRKGRPAFIAKLREALDIFLKQIELLGTSEMARRDLVDIARQWIAERVNQYIYAMRDAFVKRDTVAFKHAAAPVLGLLDDQTRLLASFPPYRLDRKIEKSRDMYGGDAATRTIKHLHVWCTPNVGSHSVPLRDYYRMDLDGLVADYYKPRVAKYIDVLRQKLVSGETTLTEEELETMYSPIEEGFINAPVHSFPNDENPVDVVHALINAR